MDESFFYGIAYLPFIRPLRQRPVGVGDEMPTYPKKQLTEALPPKQRVLIVHGLSNKSSTAAATS